MSILQRDTTDKGVENKALPQMEILNLSQNQFYPSSSQCMES